MSLSTLGRRFERLLFFAGPLSLASALILFVGFAIDQQEDRRAALCYKSGADLLETKVDKADDIWGTYAASSKGEIFKLDYVYGLRKLFIDTSISPKCWDPVIKEIDKLAMAGPRDFISNLRKKARALEAIPIKFPGVELPEKAKVDLIGTSLAIEWQLFAQLLQAALAPLLLLWLGSLYNTRYRETQLIHKARQVTELFPHVINVYPVGRYPEPRRRDPLAPLAKLLIPTFYLAIRVLLLLLFIGPPVAAYVGSVVLSSSGRFFFFVASSLLVGISAIGSILLEATPWHVTKLFPGPIRS